jgi:hypothetical protein
MSSQELALIVMGEGVGLSTVRLQDDAPGYGDPERTKPVFRTFPGPRWNDGQHLGYFDLTVHTGDRNPGAVGIDHFANNVGGSRHVRIEAGEGGGAVGLDFWRNLGGITYLSHIDVVGFDVGFNVSGFLMTLPMEHCSVRDARIGVALSEKGMQLRGFATTNVTHPDVASGNLTSLIVLDSQLIGTATGMQWWCRRDSERWWPALGAERINTRVPNCDSHRPALSSRRDQRIPLR